MLIKKQEANSIRNKKEYPEITTNKNGTYFTTPNLQSYRREFDSLSTNYNNQQMGLASEIVNVASSYSTLFEKLGSILAHVDVITGLS